MILIKEAQNKITIMPSEVLIFNDNTTSWQKSKVLIFSFVLGEI